ncbi:putative DMT superfamily transporter inner membrane protein [Clostridium tepidiprofundi DSM 19306]|uniref:Putative DMT superfamily transporter inner membrane protein n=1 Tax=Clostridium tepidiprofundi DSM 19306 TaxID=1121338 RepID=A0A151B6S2_9CLOT|nr:EamA family transporter [Clostridium tepidiprofundi]KYH35480.1 putative DMT superfamily transporter inner membrane protein [Clostridium tepidiprofundi DSM 19306]
MKKGIIYIVLAAFIFSTMEVVGKMIAGDLNAFQVTFLRFLIGCVVLLPLTVNELKKRSIKINKDDIIYFILTGLLCIPISMVLLQVSVGYTKASTAAIMFSTNPVFTIPFAYFILKESIRKENIYSIAISLIGILFIFNPLSIGGGIKGMLIALASSITFSLYTVISKKRIEKYGGIIFNFFTFLVGDLVLLVILIMFNIPIIKGVTVSNMPIILYLGIILTGLGYVVYIAAIKETSPVVASTVFFIKPALAPIVSVILLKESITFNVIIGIAFILIGSYIGFRGKQSQNI